MHHEGVTVPGDLHTEVAQQSHGVPDVTRVGQPVDAADAVGERGEDQRTVRVVFRFGDRNLTGDKVLNSVDEKVHGSYYSLTVGWRPRQERETVRILTAHRSRSVKHTHTERLDADLAGS